MIKNSSLKQQLLVSILSFIIIGMGVLFYFSYTNLKTNIDVSQEILYNQKIDNIIYLIEQKDQKLKKTGMISAYDEVFKKGTIDTIKGVFSKNSKDIYPYIIDKNRLFLLHPDFNKKNSSLYKNEKNFLNIIKIKSGSFDLLNEKNDRWTIFKYYEPWDWIIGYRVHKDVKYKELDRFRDDFLISSFFVLLAIFLSIIFIVKKVLTPITRLTNVSKEISSGNFEANIQIDGATELKDLSNNFDIMRNKILADIKTLKKNDEKIKGFNEKLKKEVKERTQDLLEQKNSFETLFNESSDGLSLLKNDKFVDCNKALLNMLGFEKKEEFLKYTPSELSPSQQPDGENSSIKVKAILEKCLNEGTVNFEWVHLRANKKPFWTEILLTKIIINHEVMIYAVWRDIQDKKELELELHNKNFDLQESNDELETMIENLRKTQNKLVESEKLAGLGSLVAGVAHEINTPIGVGLTGSSHLEYLCEDISEKYKNEQMTEEDFEEYLKSSTDLVRVINSNLVRTADIIKNFKQVAVDQTSEQKRVFKIKEYIKGVLISIDNLTKQKDIEFQIDCEDDFELTSYPGFFAQIVTNLVANSVLHGFSEKDKGIINFNIKNMDKYLLLEYRDDGKGIGEENLTKIYEPFFTTNREAGGSGLGLNIVYNLVTTNLKGTIDCKSEIEKGTTFTIKIPL